MARKKRKSGISKWLILGGAIAGGYLWLRSQIALITFGGISIPYQAVKGTKLVLKMNLPIINASALAARVTGFTGFITTPTGATIATVYLQNPVVVQRYGQSVLTFVTEIGLGDIAAEAGSVLLGGNIPTTWEKAKQYLAGYKLKGSLRVYGLPLPIETTLI